MAGAREQALAAGCDEFDTKPIDLDRLKQKIDAALGRARVAGPIAAPSRQDNCRTGLEFCCLKARPARRLPNIFPAIVFPRFRIPTEGIQRCELP